MDLIAIGPYKCTKCCCLANKGGSECFDGASQPNWAPPGERRLYHITIIIKMLKTLFLPSLSLLNYTLGAIKMMELLRNRRTKIERTLSEYHLRTNKLTICWTLSPRAVWHMARNSQNDSTVHFFHEISRIPCEQCNLLMKLIWAGNTFTNHNIIYNSYAHGCANYLNSHTSKNCSTEANN